MRPILFDKSATAYTTNGLGRLDCISCKVTEEKNGMYELAAVVPQSATLASSVEMDSLIVAKPYEGASLQPFRVYKITKPINGRFTVLAQHISYQLSYIPVMPFSVTASAEACASVMEELENNAAEDCPFTLWTDVTTEESYTQEKPASMRSCLLGGDDSVVGRFGGELEWDLWEVKLHENRGKTTPTVTLRYGKNITDITQEEYVSETITGVVPYWTYADGKMITLPEKVVYSQYADKYAFQRTAVLDMSSVLEEQPSEEELRAAAIVEVNKTGVGIPTVSITVSFVDLAKTEEYADVAPLEAVKLCDMVNVYFEKLGITTTAQVVKTVYDVLLERYESIEVGTVKSSLAQTIASTDGAIIAAEQKTIFEVRNATAWLTSGTGYVVAVKNTDGSWKELLFMDTPNTETAKKVLRINENGIGFSSTGVDGPYTQAWTLDGRMVIGGTNVPSLTVYDDGNNILFQIDKNGMEWNAINSYMTKTGSLWAKNMTAVGGNFDKVYVDGTELLTHINTIYADITNNLTTMREELQAQIDGIGDSSSGSSSSLGKKINARIDRVMDWTREYFTEKRYYNNHKHVYFYYKSGNKEVEDTHKPDLQDDD